MGNGQETTGSPEPTVPCDMRPGPALKVLTMISSRCYATQLVVEYHGGTVLAKLLRDLCSIVSSLLATPDNEWMLGATPAMQQMEPVFCIIWQASARIRETFEEVYSKHGIVKSGVVKSDVEGEKARFAGWLEKTNELVMALQREGARLEPEENRFQVEVDVEDLQQVLSLGVDYIDRSLNAFKEAEQKGERAIKEGEKLANVASGVVWNVVEKKYLTKLQPFFDHLEAYKAEKRRRESLGSESQETSKPASSVQQEHPGATPTVAHHFAQPRDSRGRFCRMKKKGTNEKK